MFYWRPGGRESTLGDDMDVSSYARRGAPALAAALVALAFFVPSAGAAECSPTVAVPRDGRIGTLQFKKGEYRIGVSSRSRLSCAEATGAFRGFARNTGKELPRRWSVDASTRTFKRGKGETFGVTAVAGSAGGSTWNSIQDFAVIW